MGHIFLKTAALSFTGYAIYKVVENAAPLVEITRQVFPAPHPERGVAFSPLKPVMHQVQLWESSNGTTLDTLRGTLDIDASINNELMVTFFDIVVDRGNAGLTAGDTGDPVALTSQYLDARMKDKLFTIVQRNYGPLRPEDEYTDEKDSHGGFSLTQWVFSHFDTYFITIYGTTVVENEPSPFVGPEILLEEDNATLDSTYFNKFIIAIGGGDLQTFIFPSFLTIPDNTRMIFSTDWGIYKYLKLEFGAGDSVRVNDLTRTSLYLSRCEKVEMVWKSGVCYCDYRGRGRERGKIYGDYLVRVGTAKADGTEYTKAGMAGFYDWLINEAPSDAKCTYAEWAESMDIDGETVYLKKGLFAVDLAGEKFKMPDARGMFERYLLAADEERVPNKPGIYEHFSTKFTYRKTTGTGGAGEGDILTDVGYQGADPDVSQFREKDVTVGTETKSRNIGKIALVIL